MLKTTTKWKKLTCDHHEHIAIRPTDTKGLLTLNPVTLLWYLLSARELCTSQSHTLGVLLPHLVLKNAFLRI